MVSRILLYSSSERGVPTSFSKTRLPIVASARILVSCIRTPFSNAVAAGSTGAGTGPGPGPGATAGAGPVHGSIPVPAHGLGTTTGIIHGPTAGIVPDSDPGIGPDIASPLKLNNFTY